MLDLDLMLLRDPERFEEMCFRLARYEFPDTVPFRTARSWDSGRDVVVDLAGRSGGHVVLQCKFMGDLTAAKPKIVASLDALVKETPYEGRWILCLPVDPSGKFWDWLKCECDKRDIQVSMWGRSELLARLEQHPDVIETFFYRVFAELALHFRSASLDLYELKLDPECQWNQADAGTLCLSMCGNVGSADLVLDIVVRNRGTVGAAITGIQAEVFDWHMKMHGLPGEGLLFSKITYAVSIQNGRPGVHATRCEPPLKVNAGDLERFKIRITDTGYAWNGGLRVSLQAGPQEKLFLPVLRIRT
jgi:hypothetical protein